MRTVPPRMPSQSASSESTSSVVRISRPSPPTSAASAVGRGVALAVRAFGDAAEALGGAGGQREERDLVLGPPGGEGDGARDPLELGDRAFGVGQVVDEERAEREVERVVGERQVLRVGVHELDVRMPPAGLGEHAVGEVDAGRDARRARPRRP